MIMSKSRKRIVQRTLVVVTSENYYNTIPRANNGCPTSFWFQPSALYCEVTYYVVLEREYIKRHGTARHVRRQSDTSTYLPKQSLTAVSLGCPRASGKVDSEMVVEVRG